MTYFKSIAVCIIAVVSIASGQGNAGNGRPFKLKNIPPGQLKTRLGGMPTNIQAQVLGRLAELEVPAEDFQSLRVHPRGELFYVCDFSNPVSSSSHYESSAEVAPPVMQNISITGAVSIASPPAWHSCPGSTNVLFLDFNGAVVSNTAWNSDPEFGLVAAWDCRPYSMDANEAQFSIAEQQAMRTIWERVAEDYAPFDIDVTTEQPPAWNRHTGHVLITSDFDKNGVACPHEGAGGIAFIDVFGRPDYSYDYAGECYSPAWVWNDENFTAPEYEAEAAAHEMGHHLSLSHDGTVSKDYYGGHGANGSISWGPIMGTGYTRNVSQWSKGDYRLSNNPEDDLALIAARLAYRPDDSGDDNLSAISLSFDDGGVVFHAGIVEQTLDTDVYIFQAVSGQLDIAANPYRDAASTTWGGNLDIVLELYDEWGSLLATNNPTEETSASLSMPVTNGTYYLHIHSTGVGDPFFSPTPSGYVRYGSIGQYVLTGSFPLDPDLDGDGLPNTWEFYFFGGLTNAVATGDVDNDGFDNLAEYVSGYDPTNASSLFSITEFDATTNGAARFIVYWDSIPGRVYGVHWSDQLNNTFTNISGDLPYPAGSFTDTVERTGAQHFYRVEVRLSP